MRKLRSFILLALFIMIAPVAKCQQIQVAAAASLKESFTSLAHAFEATHPGVKVALDFAGSQTLALQINEGAPYDLFASADFTQLNRVKLLQNTNREFATNQLVVITPVSNRGFHRFVQLEAAQPIILAAHSVPCGAYALVMLQKAARAYTALWRTRVLANVASYELDVRAVLTKIELGDGAAGIVYTTDAATAKGKVKIIPIPAPLNVIAHYPLGVPASSPHKSLAVEFENFILSPQGQHILKHYGFGPPARKSSS